jgi:2-oxoglutarate ferredoxin oxidoreductase subunit alpha
MTGPKKVAKLAEAIPEQELFGPERGDLLLVSWGSTFGAVRSAASRMQARGKAVSHAHIRYLNPFPRNLGDILSRFERILVPEMNMGQLAFLLKGTYCDGQNFVSFPKVQGRPFTIGELTDKIESLLKQ